MGKSEKSKSAIRMTLEPSTHTTNLGRLPKRLGGRRPAASSDPKRIKPEGRML